MDPAALCYDPKEVIALVLGGGAGTRLFPLTQDRAKPAVPLAGKYRLVDIPISNCLHSDLRRIFLLTQFNSASLHRHVQQSYRFDEFSTGFVEIMAAQQTHENADWYQGTADAVRQNLAHFENHPHQLVLVLSGDQLYQMNFRNIIQQHLATQADVTVACLPVSAGAAPGLGILQLDGERRIHRFVEKPKDPGVLQSLRMDPLMLASIGHDSQEELYLASMGIYVFSRGALRRALETDDRDFGKEVIPSAVAQQRVFGYVHQGYWEDIGTIGAFYEANLDLCEPVPKFNFYSPSAPLYTRALHLPATKIVKSTFERALVADGCILNESTIVRSIVGIRSRIEAGTSIYESILMGHDQYETEEARAATLERGLPAQGIGSGCVIERAIIDKNARIGRNVRISPRDKPSQVDGDGWFIRDGIVVIPKGAVIPDGTTI